MIDTLILTEIYNGLISLIDIVLVFLISYRLLSWLQRTHAFDLIKGLSLIFFIFLFSSILNLTTLNWVLEKFTTVLLIVVVIIFQPELRRFLERVGSTQQLFPEFESIKTKVTSTTFIQQILRSIEFLSKEKIGAIIVFEGQASLQQYIDSGVSIQGDVNSEVLSALFWPGSPTHDGAVIIRSDKIEAASCFLPLTEFPITDRRLGTRHRAAMGVSEVSDAVVVVVSEETGVISLVEKGAMTRYLTKEALETRLFSFYSEPTSKRSDWKRLRSFFKYFSVKK